MLRRTFSVKFIKGSVKATDVCRHAVAQGIKAFDITIVVPPTTEDLTFKIITPKGLGEEKERLIKEAIKSLNPSKYIMDDKVDAQVRADLVKVLENKFIISESAINPYKLWITIPCDEYL